MSRPLCPTMSYWILLAAGLIPAWFCGAMGCSQPETEPAQPDSQPPSPGEQGPYPTPTREFRGVWVASVSNIDWPSDPTAPPAKQQAEARALLDRAQALHLNAVILQVRPSCDALYPSKIEPWSAFLTGKSGQAPDPYYDPLEFWVTEAHHRGLELHAWFNPYRAATPGHAAALSADHIVKRRPDLVRSYGAYRWLDPGEPEAADYSLSVLLDVVRRYDIDAVHIDDYFYPYKSYGMGMEFPDDASWQKYQAGGGTLKRGDWRRQNVNQFIMRLQAGIKEIRPEVRFGISPFGIWRPGNPAPIGGLDAYDELYADSKLWLNQGWMDYFSPQLYWPIQKPAQSYTTLLDWWISQNSKNVHLWPGDNVNKVADGTPTEYAAGEIIAQINATRVRPGSTGNVHFSMSDLVANRQGLSSALRNGVYADKALVPASPWLDANPPPPPAVHAQRGPAGQLMLQLVNVPSIGYVHVVYWKDQDGWHADIVPANGIPYEVHRKGDLAAVAASTISRAGIESSKVSVPLP